MTILPSLPDARRGSDDRQRALRRPAEVAVDYGFVLVVLDTRTGQVRAMRDDQRRAWLEYGSATEAPAPPVATTTVENMTRLPQHPEIPPALRWSARGALGRAYLAGRAGFRSALRLVGDTHRAASELATAEEVRELLTAVRVVAPLAPFRVRPLDTTVAAMLMLRARRRTAVFRFGTTVDPVRTHAWLEIDGTRIHEADWVYRYTPFPSS